MSNEPLYWWSATTLRDALAAGDITAVDVMTAFLDRIEEANDRVNVIVNQLSREDCMALAEQADALRSSGSEIGPLHGLPIAIKDLSHAQGIPTTYGCRAFSANPPAENDSPHVALLRDAGALIIGKTNTPEFGVGTLTFNDVFGTTRNPYDLDRHAGGSTGGGAAVAAGMLPFCDGSDSGGSLRYPAAFCNIVGLRPTPGMVPSGPSGSNWSPHALNGVMGRECADAALLLSAMSGSHREAPLSTGHGPTAEGLVDVEGIRLAWSSDLGGLPVDPEMRAALARVRSTLEAAGVEIVDIEPNFDGVDEAWQVIEMYAWYSLFGDKPLSDPELYRDDFIRNVTEATGYSVARIKSALDRRNTLYQEMAALLDSGFDAFVSPATPIVAPPADEPWAKVIDGVEFDRYFQWQRMACRLAVTSHPVLALPATFSAEGLPIGIQLTGAYGRDHELLSLGRALEPILGVVGTRPRL